MVEKPSLGHEECGSYCAIGIDYSGEGEGASRDLLRVQVILFVPLPGSLLLFHAAKRQKAPGKLMRPCVNGSLLGLYLVWSTLWSYLNSSQNVIKCGQASTNSAGKAPDMSRPY
jgi:hypothetical protein